MALEKGKYLIPFRTQKSSPSSPMVLHTRVWESRSSPSFFLPHHPYSPRSPTHKILSCPCPMSLFSSLSFHFPIPNHTSFSCPCPFACPCPMSLSCPLSFRTPIFNAHHPFRARARLRARARCPFSTPLSFRIPIFNSHILFVPVPVCVPVPDAPLKSERGLSHSKRSA